MVRSEMGRMIADKLGWAGVVCPFGGFRVDVEWEKSKLGGCGMRRESGKTSLGNPVEDRYTSQ